MTKHQKIEYPDWWQDGVTVFDDKGTGAVLRQAPDGVWTAHFTGNDAYIMAPSPELWKQYACPRLGPMQLRTIRYEADRLLCNAFGHFGIKEWNSLPDTVRSAKEQPLAPLKSDGLGQIRSDLQKALQDVFGKWLDA